MVSFAGALVLNMGTLTPPWIESMLLAAKKARALGVPAVLEPVSSSATELCTRSSRRIIDEAGARVVRGNASEVLSLTDNASRTKGVDSAHSVDEASQAGRDLALATAVIGAFLAVEPDPLEATAAALAYVGLAGERAAAVSSGPGSLQVNLLDAMYNISPADLAQGANIRA